jgi:hypothetical protein
VKVYCEDCKYYTNRHFDEWRNNYYCKLYSNPMFEQNFKNDCKDFKPRMFGRRKL